MCPERHVRRPLLSCIIRPNLGLNLGRVLGRSLGKRAALCCTRNRDTCIVLCGLLRLCQPGHHLQVTVRSAHLKIIRRHAQRLHKFASSSRLFQCNECKFRILIALSLTPTASKEHNKWPTGSICESNPVRFGSVGLSKDGQLFQFQVRRTTTTPTRPSCPLRRPVCLTRRLTASDGRLSAKSTAISAPIGRQQDEPLQLMNMA